MNRIRPPIYRSRRGIILGVCKGVADNFGIPVVGVRIAAILLSLFTAFWPVMLGYVVAALIMRPEPVVPPRTLDEREFYESYITSRSTALGRLKDQFDRLDRRIGRMEDIVTSREYRWKREMH
ncbi:MAG: PspC domain-containing protein [Chitinivibrionales bacterium]|nr:PspC domain-containing protein [Chitinivibrionales bacterium]MBD3358062.1 PspC domain-containing protein [Chitinivibrionales bacterium]